MYDAHGKTLEIEVKFRVSDLADVERKLIALDAVKVDEGFERNLIFDRNGEFEAAEKLLRLRSYAGGAMITYKEKVPSARFKVRKELNLSAGDFEGARKLLEALGFAVVHVYEKRRMTYGLGDVGITLDEVPMLGKFIEIEGSEAGIEETAAKLGFSMDDAILENYNQLFRRFCGEKGLKCRDMVFGEAGA